MTDSQAPTQAEIDAFVARHGLARLTPQHRARMRELAVYVAELSGSLPRVTDKAVQPTSFTAPHVA